VGWQIYQLKHDALLLGLMGLTEAIPAITCSFFSGHVVDISRPARVFQLSVLVLMLNTFFIFMSVAPGLNLHEDMRIFILFAGIFISGAARSFTSPAVFSLIPQIVPRNMIPSAAAFNSSTYQFAAITGPALGGLIYGFVGPVWAFLVPCALALLAFIGTYRLSSETRQLQSGSQHREPFLKSVESGWKFVLAQKVLLSAMALDMFSVLFGGAVAVLPIFADKVFSVGSTGLGFLRAAPAVGSVLISVSLALRPMKVISGARLLFVVAGFGVCTILFALTPNFYLALVFLALSGVFDGISMVIRGTILQLLTPDHMRGRVSSLSSIFITSSNEIGAFESGLAARLMGLIPSVIFGGVMTLLVVGGVSWFSPELKETKIDS
jgi:MFS family permease